MDDEGDSINFSSGENSMIQGDMMMNQDLVCGCECEKSQELSYYCDHA